MILWTLIFSACTWNCEAVCDVVVEECGLVPERTACELACAETREEPTSWRARECVISSDCGEVLRGDCAITSESCSGMNHLLVYDSTCFDAPITLTIDELECDYDVSGGGGALGEPEVDLHYKFEPTLVFDACEVPVGQDVACALPEGASCLVSGRRLL